MTHHHTLRSSHLGFLSGSVFQSTRSSFSREHFGLPHQTGNMKSFRSHYNNLFIRRCRSQKILKDFHLREILYPLKISWLDTYQNFLTPMFEAKALHLKSRPINFFGIKAVRKKHRLQKLRLKNQGVMMKDTNPKQTMHHFLGGNPSQNLPYICVFFLIPLPKNGVPFNDPPQKKTQGNFHQSNVATLPLEPTQESHATFEG